MHACLRHSGTEQQQGLLLLLYFLRSAVFGILGSPYPRIRAASAPSVVEQAPCISLRTGLLVELIYARRREHLEV